MSGTLARYEKLQNLLRSKILSGQFAVGDRFYSQNELMEKYSLSFATVSKALEGLVREGFLLRKQGKGTFISSLQTTQIDDVAVTKNVYIFTPWESKSAGVLNTATLYRQLETQCPQNLRLKFTPHGAGIDDLEPFLFARDPIDVAVFLYPLQEHSAFIRSIAADIPTVVVSDSIQGHSTNVIQTDLRDAAAKLTSHLIDLGHSRIGVVGAFDGVPQSERLLDGYKSALKASGLLFDESAVGSARSPQSLSAPGLVDLIADCPQITAVIALSSADAVKTIAEINALGRKVPQELSIVCFDDMEKAAIFSEPLSTVCFSSTAVATCIAELLCTVTESSSEYQRVIDPVFADRGSTAPPPSLATQAK